MTPRTKAHLTVTVPAILLAVTLVGFVVATIYLAVFNVAATLDEHRVGERVGHAFDRAFPLPEKTP